MSRIKLKKITLKILLFISIMLLSNTILAQEKKITIQQKSISIKKAFAEIEKQTGYSIAYEQSKLDLKKKISLSLTNTDLNTALIYILKDTKHSFKIKGYHIIVLPDESPKEKDESEKPTQTIRGIVTDSKTGAPIEYASVGILNSHGMGSITDSLGHFRINNVPVGRHNIQISYIGYENSILREILVTSSKEVYLKIPIVENMHLLKQVVIQPRINKGETLNQMALTGGRMLSMEEANRFANGFDDPARLVSAFAGVASDVGSNAIAVRGNSPQFVQWRLEGVEIPNPAHFADVNGVGGGVISALSSQLVGNSDFYNGAFPAEYNNALSGVFDMYIRNGNNENYEHSLQTGMVGIDAASEGPISKKRGSSYILNYRLSNTTLISQNELDMMFQDLALKVNFPIKNGSLSVWGLGLIDEYTDEPEKNKSDWKTVGDRQNTTNKQYKASGGISHKHIFNENTYLKTSYAVTYTVDKTIGKQEKDENTIIDIADIRNEKEESSLHSYLNKKFNSKHINRTGISYTQLQYDIDYQVSPNFGLNEPMERISKGDGESGMWSVYSTSIFDINKNVSLSMGITGQYFNLNKNYTIEPRASLKWKFLPKHSLATSYGLHSRRERLDYYFIEKTENGIKKTNKNLDFAKAHHVGLTYDWDISPNLHFKAEPYFQYLYDIPVEKGTSFSIINHMGIYLDKLLVNRGKGLNYGIDITLEQYLNKGFYYMFTGSLFKSRYMGGDDIWRNSRLDRIYILNILAGKEWMVGKHKQNMFNLNVRLFMHGGDRYSPIDEDKSHQTQYPEYDDANAFTKRFNPGANGDISASYKINKQKISHEISLKMLNVVGYTGMHFYEYNEITQEIEREKGIGIIPNLSYKIQF